MEYKNFESLTHSLMTPRILKTITQLLLLVSLCCYIFSHSSCGSFFLHSLKFYVSAIPLHSLDKRWMFLICNGILVVLANTSGLACSPSGLDHNVSVQNKIGDDHLHAPAVLDSKGDIFLEEEVQVLLLESAEQAGNAVSEEKENSDEEINEVEQERIQDDHQCCWEEEQGDNLSMTMEDHQEQLEPAGCEFSKMEGGREGEAEAEEIRICIVGDDEENENHSEAGFHLLEGEEEEEEEEEETQVVQGKEEEGMLEKLSAEELNKKFEDFIRKMKEELRIEAQQHYLVVVK